MTIWKKALSIGTSAALLASLFTAAIAAPALASVTVTSVGSIPIDGTSTGEMTLLFTERSAGAATCPANPNDVDRLGLPSGAGEMTVTILDVNDVNGVPANVTFSGTPVKSGPGSLGTLEATTSANVLTIKWTASDCFNVETIQVSGLKIKADANATPGPVYAVLGDTALPLEYLAFFAAPRTGVATGVILDSADYGTLRAGQDFAELQVSSVCWFSPTAASVNTGKAQFSDAADARDVVALTVTPPLSGVQLVEFGQGAVPHGAGVTVTQTVDYLTACPAGALTSSVGVIGDSLVYNKPAAQTRINPSENNQPVEDLSAKERTAGFLKVDATITLKIDTAGVTFSTAPNADVTDASTGTTLLQLKGASPAGKSDVFGVLSADRTSVTWTVAVASGNPLAAPATGGPAFVTFDGIFYDVASSVTSGTAVNVTLTTSAGLAVPTSRSNAVVGRVLSATATAPVVYIGENNQTAGQITVTEAGPGFFQAGSGANNTLAVCILHDFNTPVLSERFASAPWAKVTAGDLKLREGSAASTDNVVQGTAIFVDTFPFQCYYWTVWTASTTASTIVLSSDEAGTTGLKIDVPAGSVVGPVIASVRTGNVNAGVLTTMLEVRVTFAVRQFRSQVAVTALSQPVIPVGSNGSKVGDIQIQETANGQLKTGEEICVDIVPNQNFNDLYDAFLIGSNTADRPLVTASNGIVAGSVTTGTKRCDGSDMVKVSNGTGNVTVGTLVESFRFSVTQQSTSGNGKLVISNIKYATVNDAVEGPVMVNVYGYSGSNTMLEFQSLISNARIGTKANLNIRATSAVGNNPTSGYTTKTPKYLAAGGYVTWKFTGGSALAGQRVNILVAKKINGAWGGPAYFISRWADANGIVTFVWKSSSPLWINVRAEWPGNANYGVSTSPALGANWQ